MHIWAQTHLLHRSHLLFFHGNRSIFTPTPPPCRAGPRCHDDPSFLSPHCPHMLTLPAPSMFRKNQSHADWSRTFRKASLAHLLLFVSPLISDSSHNKKSPNHRERHTQPFMKRVNPDSRRKHSCQNLLECLSSDWTLSNCLFTISYILPIPSSNCFNLKIFQLYCFLPARWGCMHVYMHADLTRPLQTSVLSLRHVDSGAQPQVLRLPCKAPAPTELSC